MDNAQIHDLNAMKAITLQTKFQCTSEMFHVQEFDYAL